LYFSTCQVIYSVNCQVCQISSNAINAIICYQSVYRYSADREESYIGVTQIEEINATGAFPCWDEPAAKATFDITLVVPKDRAGLSNLVHNVTNCFDFGLLNICTLYSQ